MSVCLTCHPYTLNVTGTKFSDFATFVISVPWFRGSARSYHISFHSVKYRLMSSLRKYFWAFCVGIRSTWLAKISYNEYPLIKVVISIKSVSLSTAYTDTILIHHWAHLTWPFVRQWFWPLMVLNFEHILMIIFVHPFPSCEDIGIRRT